MNAIEKIISQMNEAAEQERAALEQEERMKIDQNFEQKRTQVETEHQKQKEKQIELLEKKYRQLRKIGMNLNKSSLSKMHCIHYL